MLASSAGAEYAADYRDISGIRVPFTRRVYDFKDGGVNKNLLLVGIGFKEVDFR